MSSSSACFDKGDNSTYYIAKEVVNVLTPYVFYGVDIGTYGRPG